MVGWGEVQNKPDGFADGVDNVGVKAIKITRVKDTLTVGTGGDTWPLTILCPSGSTAIGGGYVTQPGLLVHASLPNPPGGAPVENWAMLLSNPTSGALVVDAYAVCIEVTPQGAFTVVDTGEGS